MIMRRVINLLVGVTGFVILHSSAAALEECGSLQNAYGPYDYWTDKDKLPIVEGAHFTPEVETLKKGKSGRIGGDIDYTLRAFPNHPRALFSMVRLGDREKTEQPAGANFTVRCYLLRAIRFRPEDSMVRMIYGTYLAKQKKNAEALEQLEVAAKHAQNSANLHYNLGLVYFDLKDYGKALSSAHKAYQLGFQLPGLRRKLENAGYWRDSPPSEISVGETPVKQTVSSELETESKSR